MTLIHFLRNQRTIYAFIVVSAIILLPFAGAFAESDKKPKPMPMTTNNPDISKEELAYRIQPLTKDDLSVEANGWLKVLKKHVRAVSEVQIQVLTAEGEQKTKLLESVTKLKEEQTALADRLRVVIEELRSKGGKIEDYEAYITAVSGVEIDVSDNYWDVYWDITRAVKERFDAEGVSIPFPQRDVHLHQTEATA